MKASTIMTDAATLLLDAQHVRWPLPEIAGWIDEGVGAILLAKPSASSVTIELTLVEGTRQSLPDDQNIVQLLNIVRNVGGSGSTAGRVIKPTSRDQLDSADPYWHNPVRHPFKAEVRQFVFDEDAPKTYYVFPGNDGNGRVEASVAKLPATVVSRVANGADQLELASWDIVIGLDDVYKSPLLEYVLYRCFGKDDTAGNPTLSVTHYQAFATALGIKSQVETANSPNRKK